MTNGRRGKPRHNHCTIGMFTWSSLWLCFSDWVESQSLWAAGKRPDLAAAAWQGRPPNTYIAQSLKCERDGLNATDLIVSEQLCTCMLDLGRLGSSSSLAYFFFHNAQSTDKWDNAAYMQSKRGYSKLTLLNEKTKLISSFFAVVMVNKLDLHTVVSVFCVSGFFLARSYTAEKSLDRITTHVDGIVIYRKWKWNSACCVEGGMKKSRFLTNLAVNCLRDLTTILRITFVLKVTEPESEVTL